ncbi:MAG: 23S rRNA (cytidine(2498)-2'-O)-methyltransferase RlmM [Magnetococcales bacterium]|nr:23S rRNA (cytidine(2498)-2'-O)-methyltransferase RlmM [Magnetococcales bacterium]
MQLFAFCRPGFESECQSELEAAVIQKGGGVDGVWRTDPGYVVFKTNNPDDASVLAQKISFNQLVFTRHLLVGDDGVEPLSPEDRLTPLCLRLESLATGVGPFSELRLGWPDDEKGRVLAPLGRALHERILNCLQQNYIYDPQGGGVRAEVVFLTSVQALVGYSLPYNSSNKPMGIVRLRSPHNAPSRSALKLLEALEWLTQPGNSHPVRAHSGQTAVDLGAAPGGWSWVMAQRGVRVTAVDRADLADQVTASKMITHIRENGFHFRPQVIPHWLLCDIVDKPRKVADLIARWGVHGWCRNALFNLKLPMKKRHEEVLLCRARIVDTLSENRIPFHLQFRQLYHDREEVTGILRLGKQGSN